MKSKDKLKSALVYKKLININVLISLIILTILTLIYLSFFYKWDIREGIADYIDEHCQLDQECLVSLQAITPFSWDRAYIFPTKARKDYINKAIGMNYNYTGIGDKFIFIKDNIIIYSEEYFPDPEHYNKTQLAIYFASDGNSDGSYPKYYYLTAENNQLQIKKQFSQRDWGDASFYNIKPTNENQSEKGNPYQQ
nr:hypothetical protein [uncultured Moellerella sp.]